MIVPRGRSCRPVNSMLAHGERLSVGVGRAAGGLCVLFHPPIQPPRPAGDGPGRVRQSKLPDHDMTVLSADVSVSELKRVRAVLDSMIARSELPSGVRVVQGTGLSGSALVKASHKKKRRLAPDTLKALARNSAARAGTQSVYHENIDANEDADVGF